MDVSVHHIYEYYKNGGMNAWLVDKITKQLTVLSVGGFFMFFLSFYEFSSGIVGYNGSILGILVFMFFTIQCLVSSYSEINKYGKFSNARGLFESIGFKEEQLSHVRWRDIAYKLVENNIIENEVIIQCTVTCEDNFIIGMVDKGLIIGESFLSEIHVSFLKRIIMEYSNKEGRSKSFSQICSRYALISFILIPYFLLHHVTYSLIKYAIAIYTNPSRLVEMKWTVLGQYKFRHYNELPHEFESRMRNASQIMLRYNSLFPSTILSKIAERIAFIVSELVIALLLVLYLTPHSTTQMFIQGLTTLLITWGILDKLVEKKTNRPNPMDVEHELNDIINYHAKHYEVTLEDKAKLSGVFKYQIVCALSELLSIFTTPILLLYYSTYSDIIIAQFIDSNIRVNDNIGIIFKGTEFNHDEMDESMSASKLMQSYRQYEREYSDSQSIKYSKMLNSRFIDE